MKCNGKRCVSFCLFDGSREITPAAVGRLSYRTNHVKNLNESPTPNGVRILACARNDLVRNSSSHSSIGALTV